MKDYYTLRTTASIPISKVRPYFPTIRKWKQLQGKKPFTTYNQLFRKLEPTAPKNKPLYRVTLPLDNQTETKITIPEIIKQELEEKGIEILDYVSGTGSDPKYKNRIVKIGKYLTPDTQKIFANDHQRKGKSNNAIIILSRHPYDLLGMSTDRGWRSCMNLYSGSEAFFIKNDILQGTLIAYIVDPNDKNIANPRARILLKPAYNASKDKMSLIVDKEYGGPIRGFRKTLRALVDKHLPPSGIMLLDNKLYDDGNYLLIGKNITEKEQLAAIKKYTAAIKYIIINAGITPSETVQLAAVKKYTAAIEIILDAGITPSETVQLAAVSNGGYVIKHIIKAGIIPSETVQLAAVSKSGYVIEYIINAGITPSETVQLAAVSNDGSVIEHIIKAGITPSETVQLAAVSRSGYVIEYILDAGIIPSEKVQMAAKRNR